MYRDVRVFEYSSYRDFFCLKKVGRFKGPTNLFDLTRCSSFRIFELSRVNCTLNSPYLCFLQRMTLLLLRKKFYSQKLIKINLLKWIWRLIITSSLTNFALHFFHPADFVSISKTNTKNNSLKLSGAREVWPNNLSRTENKLSENSVFVWIIKKKLSHYI